MPAVTLLGMDGKNGLRRVAAEILRRDIIGLSLKATTRPVFIDGSKGQDEVGIVDWGTITRAEVCPPEAFDLTRWGHFPRIKHAMGVLHPVVDWHIRPRSIGVHR